MAMVMVAMVMMALMMMAMVQCRYMPKASV